MLQELDSNVIRAAQKLRQQLADSAETGMRETQLSATTCAHDDERDVSAMAIAPPGKHFRADATYEATASHEVLRHAFGGKRLSALTCSVAQRASVALDLSLDC